MDTKLKGDIAEQAVLLETLKRGWRALRPVGDRMPYDLVLDIEGKFVRIQVKAAWWCEKSKAYIVDNRRRKSNRREIKTEKYSSLDFDFAILYILEVNIFYVLPVEVFLEFAGPIYLVEDDKRQRKPKSFAYRNAWKLLTPN